MVADDSHLLEDDYATVIIVSQGADAADYKLIELASPGDLIITQDYGVASMALGKGAFALSNEGLILPQTILTSYFLSGIWGAVCGKPAEKARSTAPAQLLTTRRFSTR